MLKKLRLFQGYLLFILLLALSLCQGCAPTATQSFVNRPDLTLKNDASRVILMPVDIQLSTLTAGGVLKPEAEWTANATRHVEDCLRKKLGAQNTRLLCSKELAQVKMNDGEEQKNLQLQRLHEIVGRTILLHQYVAGLNLPGKEGFDWSLGPETKFLKERFGADYALFVYLRDSYASGGRKAFFIAAAALGVGIQMGQQVGFASLVDLESGNVVWFNRLGRQAGDLRTPEAATESVTLLMDGFPR